MIKKSLRYLLLFAVAIASITLGVVLSVGITFQLDFLDARLETLASRLLDREVRIAGPVRLSVSRQPGLQFGGLSIGNPAGWPDGDAPFLKVKNGKAQLKLVELLRGEFHILNLEFEGVDLNLVADTDHTTNYKFSARRSETDEPARNHELSSLDRLSLKDLRFSYRDAFSGRAYTLEIDKAHGTAAADGPVKFSFSGRLADKPVSLDFTGGSLTELLSEASSWPITNGRLSLADTALILKGSVGLDANERAGYLSLELKGQSLDDIGTALGIPLPDIGDFQIGSEISAQPGSLLFTQTQVQALGNSAHGDLLLSLAGERPFLGGTIELDVSDPAALGALAGAGPNSNTAAESTAAPAPPWQLLSAVDADLRLSVTDMETGSFTLNDISAVVSLADGDLVLPASLTLTGLALAAQINVSTSTPVPTISVGVSSPGAELDALLDAVNSAQTMQGELGALSFAVNTSGDKLEEFIGNLDFSLRLGPSLYRKDGEVVVALDTVALDSIHGHSLSLAAAGELLGSPLKVESRYLADAPEGASLSLDVEACRTNLLLDGKSGAEMNEPSTFTVMLSGKELCGLLDPVESFLGKKSEFKLQTSGSLESEALNVDIEQLKFGEIEMNGNLGLISTENDDFGLTGALSAKRIDLTAILDNDGTNPSEDSPPSESPQLSSSEPGPDASQQLAEELAMLSKFLDMELLPLKGLLKTDVELRFGIDELHSAKLDATDVSFTIVTEKGVLKRSPFQARIGDSAFSGSAAFDVTAMPPQAHFELMTEDFVLAELLRDFDIAAVPDVSAGSVEFDVSMEGSTVKEMLLQADHIYRLRDGRIVLPRKTLVPLVVAFQTIDFVVEPGQPAIFALDGDINERLLAVDISTDGFINRNTDKPITLELQAALADTRLDIDGLINRQIEENDLPEAFHLSTTLSGDSMDELNELFGMNMPPLGPYLVEGTVGFGGKDKLVRFYDMGLRVGDSSLKGELSLEFSADQDAEYGFHTDFEARLEAETIQLNDFQLDGWSPVTSTAPDPGDEQQPPESDTSSQKQFNLVSSDLAKQIDGSVDIEVGEVLSGTDQLGRGTLSGRLKGNLYELEKLELNVPGGQVEITGSMEPIPENFRASLFMNVKQLDYGIMARRVQPESTLKGYVNLLLDLEATAPTPLQLREHLNGRFKFGVLPEEYRAGVLDLWAANIITAALPALLQGSSSVVNCLAGDFSIEDGLMEPELFLMDTSRIRVQGKGAIDFRTNAIDFHMRPTPKSASFFSLATPISVTGTIFSPNIGVTAGGVVQTIFRQAASLVTVPFQWLFSQKLEADGAKVCSEAMRWAEVDDFN